MLIFAIQIISRANHGRESERGDKDALRGCTHARATCRNGCSRAIVDIATSRACTPEDEISYRACGAGRVGCAGFVRT